MSAFLAIDFETANSSRGSACALGLSYFEDGSLVSSQHHLINPGLTREEWDPFNTSIHGIQYEDVQSAADFAGVWSTVTAEYEGTPLIAHNAGFDMSVMRASMAAHGLVPSDGIRYTCSAAMSRAVWPMLVSASLPAVTEMLNIPLKHHDAESDALACGMIVVRALQELDVDNLDEALVRVGRDWGFVRSDLTWTTGAKSSGGRWNPDYALRARDFQPGEGDFDESHPLFGRVVVLTGSLESMTRKEAFEALARVGGIPGDNVTKKTSFLVSGEQDLSRLAPGASLSGKQKKAADLRARGGDIEIIGEDDFRRLLYS